MLFQKRWQIFLRVIKCNVRCEKSLAPRLVGFDDLPNSASQDGADQNVRVKDEHLSASPACCGDVTQGTRSPAPLHQAPPLPSQDAPLQHGARKSPPPSAATAAWVHRHPAFLRAESPLQGYPTPENWRSAREIPVPQPLLSSWLSSLKFVVYT